MWDCRWISRMLLFAGCVVCSQAYLDMFLNSTETRRLLGIEGDLYYVRNGTVNEYALSFNLLIQPEHNYIYFNWQNLHTNLAKTMPYKMLLEVEPQHLDPPVSSIPTEGEVPHKLSLFNVYLGCQKKSYKSEVNIKITLNIAIFSVANTTTLEIKRRKNCNKLYSVGDDDDRAWFKPPTTPSYNGTSYMDRIARKLNTTPTNIFYIAVGCACGLILLVALAVAVYYVKSQKSTSGERMSDTSSSKGLTTQTTHSFLRPDTPNNSVASLPMLKRGFSVTDLKPSEVRNLLGEIHIERSRVSLGEVLMEGTFGRIYHGTILVGEEDCEEEQEVLIKTVSETPVVRRDQVDVMLREGCLLKGLVCPSLLPLTAACLDIDHQPLLLYSYTQETNLKKFLLRCKVSDLAPQQVPSLSTQQFVYIAIQICRGLQFLHRRRITHKDVACRNCVVDSQWSVKVTDNALSRDLFPNDYHCLGDNENRPVKWMSVEAITERKYTPAADVWSLGVLLWELMMMGQQPYADIDPFEMATYLQDGYRVAQPHNCPDQLFSVMACCWAMNAEERPKIAQLQLCLQDFYQALGRYV